MGSCTIRRYPAAGKAVRVTVHVVSPTASPQVLLYYRLDNNTGSAVWANKPMVDDGTSGDERAGDGIYTAQLTEYSQNSQIVQFYVRASLPNGQASVLPKEGAGQPAMYMVDTPWPPAICAGCDSCCPPWTLKDISDGDGPTPPYGYAFPRLSNHYFNVTVIVNEKDIIYGCGIRPSGSPWTRYRNAGARQVRVPPRQSLSRQGKARIPHLRCRIRGVTTDLVRYWLYLLGNPTNENEFTVVKVNSTGSGVREELEPTWNDMLDRAYPNGSQGELYKVDDRMVVHGRLEPPGTATPTGATRAATTPTATAANG